MNKKSESTCFHDGTFKSIPAFFFSFLFCCCNKCWMQQNAACFSFAGCTIQKRETSRLCFTLPWQPSLQPEWKQVPSLKSLSTLWCSVGQEKITPIAAFFTAWMKASPFTQVPVHTMVFRGPREDNSHCSLLYSLNESKSLHSSLGPHYCVHWAKGR